MLAVTNAVFVIVAVTLAVACTRTVAVAPAANVSMSQVTMSASREQLCPTTALKVTPVGAVSVTIIPAAK